MSVRNGERASAYLGLGSILLAMYIAAPAYGGQVQDGAVPYRLRGITTGRFLVPELPSLKEGEVNEIPVNIKVRGDAVHDADVSARYESLLGQRYHREDDQDGVQLKMHPDGTYYVEFTPSHVGKVSLSVSLKFADGLLEREDTKGTVVLSDAKPLRIEAMGTQRLVNSLILEVPEADPSARKEDLFPLQPEAVYEGQSHPVPIPAADVQFTVLSVPGHAPPLTVDAATGMVQTVQTGHALVKMSFEGVVGYLCIDVRENYRDFINPATCADLIPRGESVPAAQHPSPNGWKKAMPPPQHPPQ